MQPGGVKARKIFGAHESFLQRRRSLTKDLLHAFLRQEVKTCKIFAGTQNKKGHYCNEPIFHGPITKSLVDDQGSFAD